MAAAGSYSKGSVAMDDFTCMGGRMANLKSYGAAGMSDLSTGRPTAHTGALFGCTSGIRSIRNQPQLQSNATPKTEDISALWRKALLPKHTTVKSGIEECGIALKIQPNTRQHMDLEQLFAEVAGICYCLITIQSNCIGLRNSQSAVNQDYNVKNEQWQHLASHFRIHFSKRDSFSVSQHSSTSPAIKRLAAKCAKFCSKEILDGLERIRTSNALSTSLLQTLVLQQYLWRLLEQNGCLSKEMDEELEYLLAHINEVLRRIWDQAERWFRGSSLFERLLDLSFEFAGRMRHWCTKMPWTICTALVVLWGVCWMFHPSQSPGTIDTLFDFSDSQNLLPEASPVADSFFEDKAQYGNTQLPSLGTFIAEAPIAESMPFESPPFFASIWSPLPTGFSYVDREPLNSTVPFFQHIDLGGPSTMPQHDSGIIGQTKDLLLGFPGEREIENFAPNSWEDPTTHSQVSELQVSMAMLTDSNVETHHRDSSAVELISQVPVLSTREHPY